MYSTVRIDKIILEGAPMKHILNVFLAVVLLASPMLANAEAEPGGIKAGGVDIYPTVTVLEKYDTNIFSSEANAKKSWITVLNPNVLFQAKNGMNVFSLNYGLQKGWVHASRTDDYLDHNILGSAHFEPSSRVRADLSASHDRMHDDRGSTFTGAAAAATAGFTNPDKYHVTAVNGVLGYGAKDAKGRFDLAAGYSDKRYDNHRTTTQTRDLKSTNAGGTFFWQVMPKTSLLLEARYNKFDYVFKSATTDLDSKEYRYYAGLEWEITGKTTGSVRAGQQQKNFANPASKDFKGFGWEANIDWMPKSYSMLNLSTSSYPSETDGTGSYIKSQAYNLTWMHEWSKILSHTVYGGLTTSKYVDDPANRKDDITSAGISLDYQVRRWLTAGVAYDYSQRKSSAANSDYKRNIFTFKVTGTL